MKKTKKKIAKLICRTFIFTLLVELRVVTGLLFLDLLRDPVFPRGLSDSLSYIPIFTNVAWEFAQLSTLVKMETYDWLSDNARANTGSRRRSKNNLRGIMFYSSISRQNPVLPIRKFPSLILPRNAIMLQHLISDLLSIFVLLSVKWSLTGG